MAKTSAAKAAPAPKAAPAAEAPAKKNALAAPVKLSADLAAVIGAGPYPRTEVISKIWAYIKKEGLQDPASKRDIKADAKLKKVFGKDKVTMFEMNKILSSHLTKA